MLHRHYLSPPATAAGLAGAMRDTLETAGQAAPDDSQGDEDEAFIDEMGASGDRVVADIADNQNGVPLPVLGSC